MPKTHTLRRSFNAGKLAPLMDQRYDQEKHLFGCRTLDNFYPLIYGAAERRPGTQFIASQKTQSAKARVEGFEHSVDDTYVLQFENQMLRFLKDGAQVFTKFGTEDLSAIGSVVAHWKMDDNAASTTVVNADNPGTHDGNTTANTSTLSVADAEGIANAALNMGDAGENGITVTDHNDFTFGDGTNDSPFSVIGWVNYSDNASVQVLISKYQGVDREWRFFYSDGLITWLVEDDSGTDTAQITTTNNMSDGWHFLVGTYDGRGGSDAAEGLNIYIDWVKQTDVTRSTESGYVAMENIAVDVKIGDFLTGNHVDNVAVFSKELSPTEVASLVGNDSTTPYEIATPYLTADLPTLDFKQSADVMFISHSDYEPRRLSRFGDTSWLLEATDFQDGPFRAENADTAKTITASATTGSVTLTAVGHSPFVSGTTAGHPPSGALNTSKSQTGALFRLKHQLDTPSIGETLDSTTLDAATSTLAVAKGVTWDFTTNGTWGTGGPSSIVLERSYDSGTTFETLVTVTSLANKNIEDDGTEEFADALYRARVSDGAGTGNASIQISIRDTSKIGVVEITAVASPQSATATVLSTLGSTNATHRFSEGAWSNLRGWPRTVDISPEERLTFAGSASKPLTSWGTVVGDFTSHKAGTLDDDAVVFTLIGSGQQNTIQWQVPRTSMMIGTVGGEHLLGASSAEQSLTPTNVNAKLKGTRGSERIPAMLVNDAILFLQRGGRKVRELSNIDTFDAANYRAEDLTVFSNEITASGIVDWAYQRTPDPMLWCVLANGNIAVMTYERQQNVFGWCSVILAGTDAKAESVTVIYGGAGNEDEVWATVSRTVNSATVRNVERLKPRDWGSTLADAFFVDSGITDTGGDTTITGLDHLEGETVQVFGDGLIQATKVVSSGQITAETTAAKYQVGLGYTSTLKPMKIDLGQIGLASMKRVNRAFTSLFKTIGGEIGPDTSNMVNLQDSAGTVLFTGDDETKPKGGWNRNGDVIVRQTNPVPMTVVALTLDIGAERD